MQKVYLLLRNNTQLGPFTIAELLQQDIQPSDLIWIEGKSQSWFRPGELELLPAIPDPAAAPVVTARVQPLAAPLAPADEPTKKKEKVPEPASVSNTVAPQMLSAEAELERKAEEIKKRALSAAATARYYQKTPVTRTTEKMTIYDTDEEAIDFTYHKKKRGATAAQVAAAMLFCILLIAGWKKGWSPINARKDTVDAVAIPHSATEVATQTPETEPANNDTSVIQQVSETMNAAMAALPAVTEDKKPVQSKKEQSAAVAADNPEIPTDAATDTQKSVTETIAIPEAHTPVEQEAVKEPEVATAKEEVSEAPEKKKKLGQVIKNMFRKKDKGEKVAAETEAADNQ